MNGNHPADQRQKSTRHNHHPSNFQKPQNPQADLWDNRLQHDFNLRQFSNDWTTKDNGDFEYLRHDNPFMVKDQKKRYTKTQPKKPNINQITKLRKERGITRGLPFSAIILIPEKMKDSYK